MAAYKVINLDSPIESDYWVDIPVRDPATNKDAVDEKGRILVERHVTRSVKNEEMSTINTAVETVNTLKEDYSTFKEEVSTKINSHDSSILTNTNNITTLTDSVANHDLQINALYSKINAIKGIDIDDFKLVTETDIKNIKSSYLPLAGGTLTGAVTINNDLTVTGTVTSTFHGNLTGNVVGNITGSAGSATNDSVGRNIVSTYALKSHYPDRIGINWDTTFKNYVNLTIDQTTVGLITTANIAQQAVNYANTCNKANSATTAGSANTAVSCTNADHATTADTAKSATKATNADKATHASTADSATKATNDSSNRNIVNTYALKGNYPDRIKFAWDTTFKGYVNVTVDQTTWGLITSQNISSQSVKHAISADNATTATNANHAKSADSATNANKATQDSAGQQINTTYIKSLSVNGRTITYTKGNGTTGTITTQDTNTTYSKVSQFTNDSGYIVDSHNFASGVTVNGYKITVG